ncbi:MAG TPA: hypothetical protein VIF62_05490 [Labilithrix sp.]|jgi:hypothetical protein
MAHPDAKKPKTSPMNGPLGVVVVIVALSIMPGIFIFKSCTSLPGQTREEFSQQYSCPLDSITSKDRSDVQATEFAKPATPPPEIAGDPARVAVWRSNQPQPWSVDFFELTGCGHHVLWGCRLPGNKSSPGVHAFCPYTRDLP